MKTQDAILAKMVFDEVRQYAPEQYPAMLTRPGGENFSLLMNAVNFGSNAEIARMVFDEVSHYAPKQYPALLNQSTYNNYNLLHIAVASGDVELAKIAFQEVRRKLDKPAVQDLMLQLNDSDWNLQAADTGVAEDTR